jgi:hypothetical protein
MHGVTILFHLSRKPQDLQKQRIAHKMCVSFFSPNIIRNILRSDEYFAI